MAVFFRIYNISKDPRQSTWHSGSVSDCGKYPSSLSFRSDRFDCGTSRCIGERVVAVERRNSANSKRRGRVGARTFSYRNCNSTNVHGVLSPEVGCRVIVAVSFSQDPASCFEFCFFVPSGRAEPTEDGKCKACEEWILLKVRSAILVGSGLARASKT